MAGEDVPARVSDVHPEEEGGAAVAPAWDARPEGEAMAEDAPVGAHHVRH